jgi:ABC-2 type transport system permease protein
MIKVLRDTWIVYGREVRPTLYEPIGLLFTLSQPLIFLALFAPMIDGMPGVTAGNPWQWFVPGILVMLGLSGTLGGAGYNMMIEMQTGSHERLLVTPLSRSALLIGRALKEIVPLLGQAVLIILITLPLGFELHLIGVIGGLVILSILGVGLGALSYAMAISLKNMEWVFWLIQQIVLMPLMILSGMLLPLEVAPRWMKTIADLNPLTYIVNAERALFAGQYNDPNIIIGVVMASLITVIGLYLGIRSMRNATL